MKNSCNTSKNKKLGFSLIELLIAMMIGAVLTTGVYQLFASTGHSNRMIQAQSRMQEDARFAFGFITKKLQLAGYFGCQEGTQDAITSFVNTTSNRFRPWRSIEGWEASGTAYNDTFSAVLNDTVIAAHNNAHWSSGNGATLDTGVHAKRRSDILKVWYASTEKTTLNTLTSTDVTFPSFDLKQGDIAIINDCQTIKLIQVCRCDIGDATACSGNDTNANFSNCSSVSPANTSTNLGDVDLTTAELRVLDEAIFFVSKRGNDRNNLPSLYWKKLGDDATTGSKKEILEGVESLQVLYGEDTDGDKTPNYYVSADSVVDWLNITSIRISLLLISRKQLLAKSSPIIFNNHSITLANGDRHLRQAFTTTIALRNRITGY
ncbi:MAG: PilW family protein [Cocleimonas sp.]|nr:PilW family protein [Cocleimonas sp.]